ncbi:A/G-specific adenine glycosylase [Anaeromyxobacter dehalogenans 2CP-1]|uniref:Adenine DNA glycosylase n=1 Tax=Anaeromyxobacter dehalogenans (strain ATCC BAA-258 / DSM 21875 / 2CP-1) TaxID=455488 RepID=B8J855_ANAD2|nr:A/G-specific adenine glycosylase [Anaeromyxobacter dehalogenans 2CP-1]
MTVRRAPAYPPPVPAPHAPARLAALRRRLLAWWDAGHRPLPWRQPQRGADPYRVWLAEVMLQQTQVVTATPYWLRFVERWPTLEALAAARDEDVLAAWSGLGYYARCRNLLAAAREALRRHGGLPSGYDALRALPGFGPYTAGAVASIAFAAPVPAVDGNVTRVLSRLFLVEGDPAARAARARVAALAAALVDRERPGDLNQALMELGATVCRPSPDCARCPVAARCAARAAGRAAELPPPRRRPDKVRLVLACAVVVREGRVALVRRPAGGLFAGLAAFPAAEVGPGAEAGAALEREARERHGLRLRAGEELGRVERVLTHRLLELRALRCSLARPPPEEGIRWIPADELDGAGLPAAMRALAGVVCDVLGQAPPPSGGARDRGRARARANSLAPPRDFV